MSVSLEKIVNLAKRRGFVWPGSEIYGGLANSWDYGPVGVLLKNNLRDAWWRNFVTSRPDMVGLDAAILMNPRVWEASGHVAHFTDPLVEDVVTHQRYRADELVAQALGRSLDGMTVEELGRLMTEHAIKSPAGNELTLPRVFSLLFETSVGAAHGMKNIVYMRGELAQSIFVDFKRVAATMRRVPPFGVAQVGRVFRNEITPGNFTFRTLEFDLMEFEYFVQAAEWELWFEYWLKEMQRWAVEEIGLRAEKLRVREHEQKELAHYSRRTIDIEYETPFGWKELFGLAYRADFDLRNHSEHSGEDLRLTDAPTGEKYLPHVVEPTFGLTRLLLMVLLDAYHEETVRGEQRVVLRLRPQLAPYQVAVLPLSRQAELMEMAEKLAGQLRMLWSCDYDVTQSIGRRYRRHDEIGTPYCVTIDFESLRDQAVTIRERDSMEQERVPLHSIHTVLSDKLAHT